MDSIGAKEIKVYLTFVNHNNQGNLMLSIILNNFALKLKKFDLKTGEFKPEYA